MRSRPEPADIKMVCFPGHNTELLRLDVYGLQYGNNYMGNMNSYSPSQTSPNAAFNARNEELLAISVWITYHSFQCQRIIHFQQNTPFMDLQLLNEDSLKQRWASSANGTFFAEPDSRAVNIDLKIFFNLWVQRLQQRQMAHQCIPLSNNDLPEAVEQFRNLCPIGNPSMCYGTSHIEHTYKSVSTLDRITYSVHRVTSTFIQTNTHVFRCSTNDLLCKNADGTLGEDQSFKCRSFSHNHVDSCIQWFL